MGAGGRVNEVSDSLYHEGENVSRRDQHETSFLSTRWLDSHLMMLLLVVIWIIIVTVADVFISITWGKSVNAACKSERRENCIKQRIKKKIVEILYTRGPSPAENVTARRMGELGYFERLCYFTVIIWHPITGRFVLPDKISGGETPIFFYQRAVGKFRFEWSVSLTLRVRAEEAVLWGPDSVYLCVPLCMFALVYVCLCLCLYVCLC